LQEWHITYLCGPPNGTCLLVVLYIPWCVRLFSKVPTNVRFHVCFHCCIIVSVRATCFFSELCVYTPRNPVYYALLCLLYEIVFREIDLLPSRRLAMRTTCTSPPASNSNRTSVPPPCDSPRMPCNRLRRYAIKSESAARVSGSNNKYSSRSAFVCMMCVTSKYNRTFSRK